MFWKKKPEKDLETQVATHQTSEEVDVDTSPKKSVSSKKSISSKKSYDKQSINLRKGQKRNMAIFISLHLIAVLLWTIALFINLLSLALIGLFLLLIIGIWLLLRNKSCRKKGYRACPKSCFTSPCSFGCVWLYVLWSLVAIFCGMIYFEDDSLKGALDATLISLAFGLVHGSITIFNSQGHLINPIIRNDKNEKLLDN